MRRGKTLCGPPVVLPFPPAQNRTKTPAANRHMPHVNSHEARVARGAKKDSKKEPQKNPKKDPKKDRRVQRQRYRSRDRANARTVTMRAIHTDSENLGDSPSTGFRGNASFLLLKADEVIALG